MIDDASIHVLHFDWAFTTCIDFLFDDEIPDVVLELLQNIFADMYRILLHLC